MSPQEDWYRLSILPRAGTSKMSWKGARSAFPLDGMDEPRLRREPGGVRDQVLPGNKKFVEGDTVPRSREGGGRPKDAGEGEGEDAFHFVLTCG
jgi:uncharacterized sporulation protein YeaH/YhbH (DUF444 family)